RFPQIRFHSVAIQRLESGAWHVEGELELHGQIHPLTVDAVMVDGHYKGSTTVRQTAFGITPIRVAGGTVKVKDDVQVDFDGVAAAPLTVMTTAPASPVVNSRSVFASSDSCSPTCSSRLTALLPSTEAMIQLGRVTLNTTARRARAASAAGLALAGFSWVGFSLAGISVGGFSTTGFSTA